MEYKISVVLLTYNHEKYIVQALESILKQKVSFPIEVLIGDDASTDRTTEILKKYEKRYPNIIKLYLRPSNLGASRNIYELFKNVKGQYIALLEGDDYWTDYSKLSLQTRFLDEHLEYSGCTHGCLITDEYGIALGNQKKIWLSDKQVFTLEDCKGFYLSGQTGTLLFRNYFREQEKNYDIIYEAHPMISDRTIQTILTAIAPIYHFSDNMSIYRTKSSEKGENATTAIFEDNPQNPLENYRMTIEIEKYIQKEFGKKLPCEAVKRMFFTVALMKALIKPTKEKWEVVSSIYFTKEAKKIQYLLLFPFEVVKRIGQRVKEKIL